MLTCCDLLHLDNANTKENRVAQHGSGWAVGRAQLPLHFAACSQVMGGVGVYFLDLLFPFLYLAPFFLRAFPFCLMARCSWGPTRSLLGLLMARSSVVLQWRSLSAWLDCREPKVSWVVPPGFTPVGCFLSPVVNPLASPSDQIWCRLQSGRGCLVLTLVWAAWSWCMGQTPDRPPGLCPVYSQQSFVWGLDVPLVHHALGTGGPGLVPSAYWLVAAVEMAMAAAQVAGCGKAFRAAGMSSGSVSSAWNTPLHSRPPGHLSVHGCYAAL